MSSHFTLVRGGGGGRMDQSSSEVRWCRLDAGVLCTQLPISTVCACVYIYIYMYIYGFYIRLYKYIADLNFWLNH